MNNENDNAEMYDQEQEGRLRDSFAKLDERLGISTQTPEYLKQSFATKLKAATTKKSIFATWKGLWGAILASFSIGLLVARFALMPATVATRGAGPEAIGDLPDTSAKVISITTGNPEEFAFKVISLALSAEMEVTSQKSGERIVLYIKPFKQGLAEQQPIKELLGLQLEAVGSVSAVITKGSKN